MSEDAAPVTVGTSSWKTRTTSLSDFIKIIALAVIYFVAGKLGLKLAFLNQSATAVWPPTGIALAAILLFGYRLWPGVWLGAFLVNVTTAGSLFTTICIAGGNTLEVLFGAWLVGRFANGRYAFERVGTILRFALWAALVSTLCGATVGVTSLALGGYAAWDKYLPIWATWWLGDAYSALAVTALILIWSKPQFTRGKSRQYFEAALALSLVFEISLLGFCSPSAVRLSQYSRFLLYPAALWASYRFRQKGAISVVILVSSMTIWGTLHGFGPFATPDTNQSLLLLQTWMGAFAMTNLILGAAVSERECAEENMRVEKNFSDTIINSLPGVFYLIDENGLSFLRWNRNLELVSGYSSAEIARMSPAEFFEGEERELIRARIEEQFAKGQLDAEAHLVCKDGKKIPYYFTGLGLPRANSKYLTGLGIDIAERKRAEHELRESQRRFAHLIESAMDGIIVVDAALRVVIFNPAAERMFGRRADEAIGKSIDQFIPSSFQEANLKHIEKFGIKGSPNPMGPIGALRGIRANGDEFPIEASISQIKDEDRKLAILILRDITERKENEAKLKAWQHELESRVEGRTIELSLAHKQLQAQVEERKRLEAEIARVIEREQLRLGQELHDGLGQQLTGIGYMMSAMQDKLREASAPEVVDAEKMERRLRESVEQVRNLAKGFYPIELERHGLLSALKEVAQNTEQSFGVRCVLQSDGSSYKAQKGPAAIQLFRIAQEAIHNAVKHAKAKSIVIRLARVNSSITVTVKDDGIGLPQDLNQATGMGLRIMQHRANMLGGKVDFRNGDTGGAIISCSIPAELTAVRQTQVEANSQWEV
jgi:PAS domain S-box-containing protein